MPSDTDMNDLHHGLYLQNGPSYLGEMAQPSHALEYAVAAEKAGWDGVFLADAFGEEESFFDPIVTLSAIASRTNRIKLGTWITPVPRRQPWQLALDLATLDELSDGRVILGAGLGAPWNYESTGLGYQPNRLGDKYDEALEIITRLWSGDVVSYEGEYFSITDMQLPVIPVQRPRIPIWLGFWWPNKKPVRRAANWDGVMPYGPSFYGADGVQGEQPTGSMEQEVTDMVTYYREVAQSPGEILLPLDVPEAPADIVDLYRDLDVTWTLTTNLLEPDSHQLNIERIQQGPPSTSPENDPH